MKKVFLTINILLMIGIFIGNYFFITGGGLELKTACSCGFVLMGLFNLVYAIRSKHKHLKFHVLLAVGLILAMLGDVYVGSRFILGAALFACGHIFYWIAQCFLVKLKWPDFLISAVLFAGAGAFVLFCPLLSFSNPVFRWVCFVYALIISLMAGKAISDFFRKPCAVTAILAIGSILFFISDLMLVFDWFIGLWSWTDEVCMATYYPAQCLLAFSAFQAVKGKER